MDRVKLHFPEKVLYTTKMVVRVDDLNYGGHVSNDVYLKYAQEARLQFLKSIGYKDETGAEGGASIIMADAAIMYKQELFHNDEVTVEVGVDNISKFGFDMYYKICKTENKSEVAIIKTGILKYDYLTKSIQKLPSNFFELN